MNNKSNQKRVLLFETDDGLRNVLKMHVEQYNLDVWDCGTAEQAQALLQTINFEVAILDCWAATLTDCDSILSKHVERWKNHPCVILMADKQPPQAFLDKIRPDRIIEKPFGLIDLDSALSDC